MSFASNETALVQSILQTLKWHRVWSYRNNNGATVVEHRFIRFGGEPGAPDILGFLEPFGSLFALEVKVKRRKQTPEQVLWQQKAERVGGFYFVVRSVPEALQSLQTARFEIARRLKADAPPIQSHS
jgi:hypothetical protein